MSTSYTDRFASVLLRRQNSPVDRAKTALAMVAEAGEQFSADLMEVIAAEIRRDGESGVQAFFAELPNSVNGAWLAAELSSEPDTAALLGQIDGETSCVVVQYPDILGRSGDLSELAERCHAAGALLVAVVTEPVALGLIRSPGEMGADIVVGEGQSIGVGLNFGGPYVGLFATRDKYVRQMPGRLAGETVDAEGKRGFVLTLSTREQHIRREKATSNICTSSVLCALAFTMHLTLLGEKGLRQLAEANHYMALEAADRLVRLPGVELVNETFFNEFTLRLPKEARPAVRAMADKGVLGGVSLGRLYPGSAALENGLVVAVTETADHLDIDALAKALGEALA
jgi:glycine dehydrogenase subunit 1